ncbi:MAG TPA: hypothetical protein PLV92_04840 [Pirellulaceae bacterium]|nr:hypothetical protein [Pirellulaceae bacterium]
MIAGLFASGHGATVVRAQDDPFGGDAKPAAGPAAKPGSGAAKAALGETLKPERDPAVLTLRESNPTTPDELTRAVRISLDLGRLDEAKRYIVKLAAANPDEATLASLHSKFGADLFLRWSQTTELQPEGAALGRAAAAAAQRLAQDSNRLQQLVIRLSDTNPLVRRQALNNLREAGARAVEPLVRVLADPQRKEEHLTAQRALVSLGLTTVGEPLIGVLEKNDPQLQGLVIEVLGELGSRRAMPFFLHPALDEKGDAELREKARTALQRTVGDVARRSDAEIFLTKRIRGYLAGDPPVRLDAEDHAELWRWDAKLNASAPRRFPGHVASVIEAARLAHALVQIAPASDEGRKLFIATQLEVAKYDIGLDQSLIRGGADDLKKLPTALTTSSIELTPAVVEEVLAFALKHDRPVAATAAAEILGAIGDIQLLTSSSGEPRPLAAATNNGDRRVRFAATMAVLEINPKQPFAGASYVADSLGFFTGTVGSRRVLIGHPRTDEAQTLAGFLGEQGYQVDTATTGRGVMVRATKHADYEFILLSDTLESPVPRELIQAFRQDSRTRRLPVGLMAELARGKTNLTENTEKSQYFDRTRPMVDPLVRAEQLAESDFLTDAFPRPYDSDGMAHIVKRIQAGSGRDSVTRDERLIHAARALDWMAKLLTDESRYSFYELPRQQPAVETALQTPELSSRAARVLGRFGTPRAQMSLIEVASTVTRPLADREAAASGFAEAVKRRALLLTRDEIQRQYERYNQSERLDADTQRVLGSILDTIEAPTSESRPGGPATDSAKAEENAATDKPNPE